MLGFINWVSRCVLVDYVKEVGEGAYDDQDHQREHSNVVNCGSDQVNEVGRCFEEPHPIEDFDPEKEGNDAAQGSVVFCTNE